MGDHIDYWSGFYSTKPVMKQKIRNLLALQRNSMKLLGFAQFIQFLVGEDIEALPNIH
jgi:hypothetical protein